MAGPHNALVPPGTLLQGGLQPRTFAASVPGVQVGGQIFRVRLPGAHSVRPASKSMPRPSIPMLYPPKHHSQATQPLPSCVGGMATSPLPSRGSPTQQQKMGGKGDNWGEYRGKVCLVHRTVLSLGVGGRGTCIPKG